jgi:HK97 family phage prohead protease
MAATGKQNPFMRLVAPHYVLSVKEEGAEGVVEHIISVLGIEDSHTDEIKSGAYKKTISEGFRRVRLLDNHRTTSTTDVLGSPIDLKELKRNELPPQILKDFPQATGALKATSRFNLNTQRGKDVFELIKAGDVNEYSVGIILTNIDFETRIDASGREYRVRIIKEVKLIEYSAVIWGANPATMTQSVKAEGEGDENELHFIVAKTEDAPGADESEVQRISQAEKDAASLMKKSLAVTQKVLAKPMNETDAARRVEKSLAELLSERQLKALSLTERSQLVRIHFYRSINMDAPEHDWWVHSVYETYLTCFDYFDPVVGRCFAVDFSVNADETDVNFAPAEQWRAGRYEFVEQAAPPMDADEAEEILSQDEAVPSADSHTLSESLDLPSDERRKVGLERLQAIKERIPVKKP